MFYLHFRTGCGKFLVQLDIVHSALYCTSSGKLDNTVFSCNHCDWCYSARSFWHFVLYHCRFKECVTLRDWQIYAFIWHTAHIKCYMLPVNLPKTICAVTSVWKFVEKCVVSCVVISTVARLLQQTLIGWLSAAAVLLGDGRAMLMQWYCFISTGKIKKNVSSKILTYQCYPQVVLTCRFSLIYTCITPEFLPADWIFNVEFEVKHTMSDKLCDCNFEATTKANSNLFLTE